MIGIQLHGRRKKGSKMDDKVIYIFFLISEYFLIKLIHKELEKSIPLAIENQKKKKKKITFYFFAMREKNFLMQAIVSLIDLLIFAIKALTLARFIAFCLEPIFGKWLYLFFLHICKCL